MDCTCIDWKQNIDKLNSPFVLQSARSGGKSQYNGKVFEFCPWCGKNLHGKAKDDRKESGMIDSIKINGVDFTVEECRKLFSELKGMFEKKDSVETKSNPPVDTKPTAPSEPPDIWPKPTTPPYTPTRPPDFWPKPTPPFYPSDVIYLHDPNYMAPVVPFCVTTCTTKSMDTK